jgi:hypothetical protein
MFINKRRVIMDVKQWTKDRDDAFASGDEEKIRAYCKKYDISIPEDIDTFWCGVHKTICNLFLNENSPITIEQYNNSYDWLCAHGSTPEIFGGEK